MFSGVSRAAPGFAPSVRSMTWGDEKIVVYSYLSDEPGHIPVSVPLLLSLLPVLLCPALLPPSALGLEADILAIISRVHLVEFAN